MCIKGITPRVHILLELEPSLDFIISFSYSLLLKVLIPQGCIPFNLDNCQLESLFIIILLEFKDPFNSLHQIKVIF